MSLNIVSGATEKTADELHSGQARMAYRLAESHKDELLHVLGRHPVVSR